MKHFLQSNEKKYSYKYIAEHDLITFDMFDTLVTRVLYEPDDVIRITSLEFANIYHCDPMKLFHAFKKSQRYFVKKYGTDGTFSEIYSRIKLLNNFSNEQVKTAKKIQINNELKYLVPRKNVQDLYRYLVLHHKKILVITDMYYPEKILNLFLRKCGYTNIPKIIVSSKYKRGKADGTLWKYFFKKNGHLLTIHIGDDYVGDAKHLKKNQKKYILIDSCKSKFDDSVYGIKPTNIADSLSIGLIQNKLFSNSNNQSFVNPIKTCFDFGYSVFGPIFLAFCSKLQATQRGRRLLFASRDGYFLQKIYKYFIQCTKNEVENKNVYLLISRQASSNLNIKTKNDVKNFIHKNWFVGDPIIFLKSQFNIHINNDINLNKNKSIMYWTNLYMDDIINSCKTFTSNYKKYLSKNIIGESTIIDIGYIGTAQVELARVLRKKINGFYLKTFRGIDNAKKYGDVVDCYPKKCIKTNNKQLKKLYFYLVECFLTAPHGQFSNMDSSLKPIFKKDRLSKSAMIYKERILDGIYAYFDDISIYCPLDIMRLNNADVVGYKLLWKFYKLARSGYISSELVNAFVWNDSFTCRATTKTFKSKK